MSNKTFKIYETVKCECGHVCPVSLVVIDEDGFYTCPHCYITELEALFLDEEDNIFIQKNRFN